MIFEQTLQERSKIEKVNLNKKFCIFKLVYFWVPNRKGVGTNEGLGNWKLKSPGGVEEIIFDTLQQNTKKLKRFELQMIAKHIKLIIKIRQQGKGEKGCSGWKKFEKFNSGRMSIRHSRVGTKLRLRWLFWIFGSN